MNTKIKELIAAPAITPAHSEQTQLATEALTELDKAQPAKVLTDEEVEKVADVEHVETGNAASGMWREGFIEGMRYARDNGYLAPAPVDIERIVGVVDVWTREPDENGNYFTRDHLRTRLTNAITPKP